MVDPWAPPAALQQASPACKVPVLLLENGQSIADSQFIVQYLEAAFPDRSSPAPTVEAISRTALAFSLLEAFASIIIGRRSLEDFDRSIVGLRRRQSLIGGLQRLDVISPAYQSGGPDMESIVTVVLVDAIRFRFPCAEWVPSTPRLDVLSNDLDTREAFYSTQPY